MFYKDWKVFYEAIIKDFNFDYNKDFESAKLLDKFISESKSKNIGNLNDLIKQKKVYIFGSGPSLINSINENKDEINNNTIISADGATSALIEKDILPDIIVTDLDGKISDQIYANKKGSITIIHAHGDNIDKIKKYFVKFINKTIGTTQIDPYIFNNLHNFGGFTDGDRCVFLADHFNASEINLLGFDYRDEIGKYSFYELKNKEKKFKKLKWCKYLIDKLKEKNSKIKYI